MVRKHISRAALLCSLMLISVRAEKPHDVSEVVKSLTKASDAAPAPASQEQPKELPSSMTLETIFGTVEVTDAVVIELLHHPAMERLKGVDQHGPPSYWLNTPTFDRYTHSVGVYVLLKKFGAPLVEQLAGLLHDASHTIFSHLADRFFKTGNEYAYQDQIHLWHLEQMGVDKVLKKHGFTVDDMVPEAYSSVKTKPPVVCADYLEYGLRTGLIHNRLTQEDITQVVADLRLENGTWFFTSVDSAKKFGLQAIYFTEFYWGSALNTVHHHWMVSALRQLVAREQITFEDVHFGIDEKAVTLLKESADAHIIDMINRCRHPEGYYSMVQDTLEYDIAEHPKNRSCNPLVMHEGHKTLLTELDAEYKQKMRDIKQYCARGIRIKLIEKE